MKIQVRAIRPLVWQVNPHRPILWGAVGLDIVTGDTVAFHIEGDALDIRHALERGQEVLYEPLPEEIDDRRNSA